MRHFSHFSLVRVCVCVELLSRSKTSTVASFSAFWFQQGDVAYNQGPRPAKLHDCMEYRAWSALRTCSIFQFVWQAAKPRTAQPVSHFCTVGTIWDCGERTDTDLFGHLTLDPRDWSILCILLLWSGIIEVLFCTTDAFHITIRNDSSEQVCYSRRFDKSPSGNTCRGKMFDPPTWCLTLQFSTW